MFKRCDYPVKVSEGLFWRRRGPSRITSSEQCGLVQQPLCLVRTWSWLTPQLFLILTVACTPAFIPAIFPVPSSCMLHNTALFPMALYSPGFFSFSWFGLCCSTAGLCDAIHEVERGRMREEKSCAGVDAQGDYSRQQELQRSWLKQPEH